MKNALAIQCPVCAAAIGARCKSVGGHHRLPHVARYAVAPEGHKKPYPIFNGRFPKNPRAQNKVVQAACKERQELQNFVMKKMQRLDEVEEEIHTLRQIAE